MVSSASKSSKDEADEGKRVIYEKSSASERENRKRKAIVLSEGLGTTSKKSEIVLHQAPLNGNQANDQSMVPLFDNLSEELIPNASDMGCDIPLLSDTDLADFAELMEMLDREPTSKRLDTTGKRREIVSQQGPLNANQENDQSMVPMCDNLSEELVPNAS
ncbi:hypothetical protein MRB53_023954 [Persea americana]|uniref:Uncharacterized protein n=1 Tax=Persea americana TaxID=3435 RepID=A0ACC2LB31_PERAE|nr:hypothetical protein MRB53_023954 [Persea americana]